RRQPRQRFFFREHLRAAEAVPAGEHVVDLEADAVERRLPPLVVGDDECEVGDEMRRVLAEQAALLERPHDERDGALLEVAHAAMHEFGGSARGALAEVVLLDEQYLVAARRRVDRDAHAGGAAADDHHVPGRAPVDGAAEHLGAVHLALSEGLRPSDSPTRALARRFAGSLRSRGSLAALVRDEYVGRARFIHHPRGFAPRTPLHALSLAASPARSVRVAHSLRSFATSTSVVRGSSSIRGASPLGLPCTRSRSPLRRLAPFAWLTRCARSRRVRRSSGVHLVSEGLRPSDSPTRALARRFAGSRRSRGLLAALVRDEYVGRPGFIQYPRGFAPRTPLHALSLAASPARAVRVAHSL